MKQFGGFGSFIGLEMADQVPVGAGEVAHSIDLAGELLHAIFAEYPDAGVVGLMNAVSREGFADRHQRDLRRVTSGALGRRLNAFLDTRDVVGDGNSIER